MGQQFYNKHQPPTILNLHAKFLLYFLKYHLTKTVLLTITHTATLLTTQLAEVIKVFVAQALQDRTFIPRG